MSILLFKLLLIFYYFINIHIVVYYSSLKICIFSKIYNQFNYYIYISFISKIVKNVILKKILIKDFAKKNWAIYKKIYLLFIAFFFLFIYIYILHKLFNKYILIYEILLFNILFLAISLIDIYTKSLPIVLCLSLILITLTLSIFKNIYFFYNKFNFNISIIGIYIFSHIIRYVKLFSLIIILLFLFINILKCFLNLDKKIITIEFGDIFLVSLLLLYLDVKYVCILIVMSIILSIVYNIFIRIFFFFFGVVRHNSDFPQIRF